MPLKFTIDAGPNTEWKVRVVIHATHKLYLRHTSDKDFVAHCDTFDQRAAISDKEAVFAELHFSRGKNLTVPYIVHEVFHAFMSHSRLTKAKLICATRTGEENAALSMEHMVENILWMLKKKRIKVL